MSLPILKRNNNSKSKNIEKIIFQPQPGPHSVPSIYPNELEKKIPLAESTSSVS